MAREFPQLWSTKFGFTGSSNIPDGIAGRMDLVANDLVGDPGMYAMIAAANGIRNVMVARPTIRPIEEAIRTELELRGVPDDQIERELNSILSRVDIGAGDWLSYEATGSSGAITDVESTKMIGMPDMQSATDFNTKYYGETT